MPPPLPLNYRLAESCISEVQNLGPLSAPIWEGFRGKIGTLSTHICSVGNVQLSVRKLKLPPSPNLVISRPRCQQGTSHFFHGRNAFIQYFITEVYVQMKAGSFICFLAESETEPRVISTLLMNVYFVQFCSLFFCFCIIVACRLIAQHNSVAQNIVNLGLREKFSMYTLYNNAIVLLRFYGNMPGGIKA